MRYADVILPLHLEGMFTYAVPDGLVKSVGRGMRVVVPLGRSKTYIAMVAEVHDRQPAFECKPIMTVLDTRPVLLDTQLRLWQWIAEYYMSAIGDVYTAAMPAGLKEENFRPKMETYVTLHERYRHEQALHVALNMLSRASQQQKVLVDFLALSHYDTMEGDTCQEEVVEISRD